MPAALSWIDHCQADLDGALEATSTGTNSLTVDPAFPAHNGFDADPSLVSRFDFKRNAFPAATIGINSQFSSFSDRTCRVIAALNLRVPADVEYVSAVVLSPTDVLLGSGSAYMPDQVVPIPGTTDRYDLYWLLAADVLAAKVQLRVQVPATTVGYIELGRLWCGPALVLSSTDSGWTSSARDRSDVQRGRGGALVAERLPVLDEIDWPLTVLSYEQAFGTPNAPTVPSIRAMRSEAGIGSPVVLIQRSDDKHAIQVLSAYAALSELPEIRHQADTYYATRIRAEQIR